MQQTSIAGAPAWILAGACALAAASLGWVYLNNRRIESSYLTERAALRRAEEVETLLDALLQGGSDGAMIWSDGVLTATRGVSPDMAASASSGDYRRIAASIAREEDVDRLAAALEALVRDGARFELYVDCLDGCARLATGRVIGGRAVARFLDVSDARNQFSSENIGYEHAAHENEALRNAFDQAPLMAWRRDPQGRVLWANAPWLQAVEAANIEDARRRGLELLGGRDGEALRALSEAAQRENTEKSEQRYAVINGRRRALNIVETPSGFGFAVDYTEEAATRATLELHLEAHAKTLNMFDAGLASFDGGMRLKNHNSALLRLWRLDETELSAGVEFQRVLDMLRVNRKAPEQVDFAAWKRDLAHQFANLTQPVTVEWHLSDGGVTRIVGHPHPLGGVILIVTDVTSMFTLVRRYNTASAVQREALAKLSDGVAVFGNDGRLQLYNPAFESMWELRRAQLHNRPHVRQLAEDCAKLYDDKALWARAIAQVTGAGAVRAAWTEILRRENESVIEMSCSPLPDGGTMFAFVDMTDSFEKEKTLRERNEALESASLMKSEFLRSIQSISSQLNTPLNAIFGFSEILSQQRYGELNEEQVTSAHAISVASTQLRNLINDIIDLAKLSADGVDFLIDNVDIYGVLYHLTRMMKKDDDDEAANEDPPISFDCPRTIGSIPADRARFQQVIYILLNILSRSAVGVRSITMSAEREDAIMRIVLQAENGRLPESLRDIFISEADFDGLQSELRGPSLGLTLARRVVEKHGGKLELAHGGEGGEAITCLMPLDRETVERALGFPE